MVTTTALREPEEVDRNYSEPSSYLVDSLEDEGQKTSGVAADENNVLEEAKVTYIPDVEVEEIPDVEVEYTKDLGEETYSKDTTDVSKGAATPIRQLGPWTRERV